MTIATKCVGFWGSAPDPAEGAHDAPSDTLVVRPIRMATQHSRLRAIGACIYEYLRKHFIVAPRIGGKGVGEREGGGDGSKEGKLGRGVGKGYWWEKGRER